MPPILHLRLRPLIYPNPLTSYISFINNRPLHLPTFPTLTPPPPQTFTSSSTLPYAAASLFSLIADIEAYPAFVPYVVGARTTAWSGEDKRHGRRWPRVAELRVGWGALVDERFVSRVYCVPDRIVEAVSGRARCEIPNEELGHYFLGRRQGEGDGVDGDMGGEGEDVGGVFERMRTRWELKELGSGMGTQVRLEVDVRFTSQVYAALSQAAGPRVAEIMVGSFEKRATEVLGEGGVGNGEKGGDKEG